MEKYIAPEIEIVTLSDSDVLALSSTRDELGFFSVFEWDQLG